MNKNSIIKKAGIAIVIPLLLQACLFILAISDSGIITALRNNSINNFKDKGYDKHAHIEEQMFQNGGHINKNVDNINSYILDTLEKKGLSTNELNSDYNTSKEILTSTSKYMMNIIKETHTTDVFLILDTIEANQENSELVEKHGIYIKNTDPLRNSKDGSDLYIEIGPRDIASDLKINTNSNWREKYTFNKNDSNNDFFYKPINEAKKHKNIYVRDFGYWGKPSIITNDNTKVITYSIPLINEEGIPYGVLGIGIDSNYISRFFKSNELNKIDGYAFFVENDEVNKNEFKLEDVIAIDNKNKALLENYKNKNIKIDKVLEDIYELKNEEDINDITYIFKKRLDLYNFNNKFLNEGMDIVLFLNDNNLFYQINRFENLLEVSILISTLVGIIISLVLVRRLTKPTIALAEKVRESNPREPLNL